MGAMTYSCLVLLKSWTIEKALENDDALFSFQRVCGLL